MFNIGDKVVLTIDYPDHNYFLSAGDIGEVTNLDIGDTRLDVGVSWESDDPNGGKIFWWVNHNWIELTDDPEEHESITLNGIDELFKGS